MLKLKTYDIKGTLKRDWDESNQFQSRSLPRWLAWSLVGLLYVGSGYASATWRAVEYLLHGEIHQVDVDDPTGWMMSLYIRPALLAIALIVITRMTLAPERKQLTRDRPVWSWVAVFVAFYFLTWTGFLLMDALSASLGGGSYPRPDRMTNSQQVLDLVHSAAAGPMEEIFLLAVPFLLLRSARCSWWSILLVLVTVRMSFHIYYGWAVLGMLIWAAGAVCLYRLTRQIVPMIFAHSMIDLAASFDSQWAGGESVMVALLVFVAVLLLLAVATTSKFTVRRRSQRSPQGSLPSSQVPE